MFHCHVETLLDHRVLVVHVGARANHRLRASAGTVLVRRLSLGLEPFLRGVENDADVRLAALAAPVLERSWSLLESTCLAVLSVLARAGHLELQRLPEENLVEIEPWRGCIEANLLAGGLLEVSRTSLLDSPSVLSGASLGAAHARDLILNS